MYNTLHLKSSQLLDNANGNCARDYTWYLLFVRQTLTCDMQPCACWCPKQPFMQAVTRGPASQLNTTNGAVQQGSPQPSRPWQWLLLPDAANPGRNTSLHFTLLCFTSLHFILLHFLAAALRVWAGALAVTLACEQAGRPAGTRRVFVLLCVWVGVPGVRGFVQCWVAG